MINSIWSYQTFILKMMKKVKFERIKANDEETEQMIQESNSMMTDQITSDYPYDTESDLK